MKGTAHDAVHIEIDAESYQVLGKTGLLKVSLGEDRVVVIELCDFSELETDELETRRGVE